MDKLMDEWKYFIENNLMPVIKNLGEQLEGNIYSLHTKTEYYNYFIEKQKNIILCGNNLNKNTNILEIGFNSGFSALLFLMSSDESVKLTCVDINCHSYTIPCYNILKEKYGDRINLITGDSNVVLSYFNQKFDLIHIDGAHIEQIAEKDIQNSIKLINDSGIIIMDDIEFQNLGELWNKYVLLYKMGNPNFQLYPSKFHSVKQIFF
jgi:predicted O-methyltransferase YrrM